jgi:spore maturation protein CgeB
MSYRFVKITTYYREYLNQYYTSNPEVVNDTYDRQMAHLMNQGYAWSNYFSIHLKKIGVDAFEIVCNAKFLQQTWVAENGSTATGLDIVLDQLKYLKPDVVFFQESYKFDMDWLSGLKEKVPSIKLTIGFCCTNFNKLSLARFKIFDFVIVCSPHFEKAFKEYGIKVYTIMHAFEVSILDKIVKNNNYPESDFIFLGSFLPGPDVHDLRQKIVEHLIKENIKIDLYSQITIIKPLDLFLRQNAYIAANVLKKLNLSKLALSLPGIQKAYYLDVMPANPINIKLIKKNSKPPLYGFEMFKALSHSKIAFNYHGKVAGDYAANMRLFEVTGVGSCLITDWKKNLNDLFEIDKEVVAFSSVEECTEKVKWLLNNPGEREKIAKAGQQRILKSHTLEMRVQQLDEIIRGELEKRVHNS